MNSSIEQFLYDELVAFGPGRLRWRINQIRQKIWIVDNDRGALNLDGLRGQSYSATRRRHPRWKRLQHDNSYGEIPGGQVSQQKVPVFIRLHHLGTGSELNSG